MHTPTPLYPFQQELTNYFLTHPNTCNTSDVGTGKTAVAIATMRSLMATSVSANILVITPKSVSAQWETEFARFAPEFRVFRLVGSQTKRQEALGEALKAQDDYKVVLVTYEQARIHIDQLKGILWDVLHADEAHRLGNVRTRTYKAVSNISARTRYGSTATPLRSSPLQVFGVVNWLQSGVLGNYWTFLNQYCVRNSLGWVLGYRGLEQLATRIQPYFYGVTLEQVGIQLPPLVEEDITFQLQPKEQRLYDRIKKELLLEIQAEEISKVASPSSLFNSAVKLGKLQECTDSLELLGDSTESSKLSTLKEHLEDTLASGNKAVVFSHFSRMVDILARELATYMPAVIQGSTDDRQEQINRFNSEPECRLMLITSAGNEGINLQVANVLYFYDVPIGSYGSLVQTIGRIKRIGQTKPMVVYYLQAEGTVDQKLHKLLLSKKDQSEVLFGSWSEVKGLL